jgi:hypothetical protein
LRRHGRCGPARAKPGRSAGLPWRAARQTVDLHLHQQGLDTSTPAGRAMFQMLGLIAELERSMIRDRVVCRMVRARNAGTKSGRAIGRPGVTEATKNAIRGLLGAGRSERISGSLLPVRLSGQHPEVASTRARASRKRLAGRCLRTRDCTSTIPATSGAKGSVLAIAYRGDGDVGWEVLPHPGT